jgi:hypothetical protein
MKSKLLRLAGIGAVLLGVGTARSAAQTLQISPDAVRSEENVSIDGWVAHLDQPAEYVEKTLGTYIKMLSGNKADKRTKTMWVAPKVKFEEFSPLRGDLRASITAEGNGTAVGFTFSPGYDIHLDKTAYPQEYEKMQGFVKKYVKHHYTEFYREEVAKAEKELNKRRRVVEKNEKRIGRLQQSITSNEQKINEGDSKATKLTERNSKNTAETGGRTQENEKLQGEVQQYQEMLTQYNAALQKVRDF